MVDNYFALLQIPVQLPIDTSRLSSQYQQLQKLYHPDNYATADDSKKAAIMQQSATINAAYQTLKDPIKAAEYLVSLQGIDINSEQHTINDPQFLQQQFELREQLDDIESANNWDELEQFYQQILDNKKEVYCQLLTTIAQHDWQVAKAKLYQLRYLTRLIEQIEHLQEQQLA